MSLQMQDVLSNIDARMEMDSCIENFMMEIAEDFIDNVVSFSSKLAKHRRSNLLEKSDLAFCLAKNYNIHLAEDTEVVKNKQKIQKVAIVKGKSTKHHARMELKRKLHATSGSKKKKEPKVTIEIDPDESVSEKKVKKKNNVAKKAEAK